MWSIGSNGELRYKEKLFIPKDMREEVLKELHQSTLAIHTGENKMYYDLVHTYWWPSLKKDIATFMENV